MKKIVYVDMDNVLVDFKTGISRLSSQELIIFEDRYDEVPNIFSKMDPMENAIESYEKLSSLYDTYILSTSPWENPTALNDKLAWIKMYLGDLAKKRVIFSHNKHLNIGDYLIDDRKANGSSDFRGEHIHFGTKEFPDWAAVLKYLNIS
jgi:5'(3')-deoxyribonucleotidase